jgi:hypothetical protein
MRMFSIFIYFLIFFELFQKGESNKNKSSGSKYDRAYSKCKSNECSSRSNDEACIFKCVSSQCYEQIYGDYTLEYGEVNYDLKNKFETCFNTQK